LGNWVRTTTTARLRVQPGTLRAALAGISQRQLAKDLGLRSNGMIGHLLSGRRTSCTPKLAERIAEVAGVEFDALFVLVTPLTKSRTACRDEARGTAA
jgi:transcriptional regulator with XRE-family HTH domain